MSWEIDWLTPATSEAECRKRLELLSEQYAARRDEFRSFDYDETTVRQDFVDPLFAALGWDVANLGRKFGKDREVVPEAKASGRRDHPDYAFTRAGQVKFFVEAKKPSVDLGTDSRARRDAIFQAKTYAYTRSAPACVLTNFERLIVFHAAIEPNIDEPHVGHLAELDCSYEDIASKAGLLWRILGRSNVMDGSLENYVLDLFAQRKRRPADREISVFYIRGARPFDQSFLEKLSAWRKLLAEAVAASNKVDDAEEVTEAVQRILDRLIFIRVCEDRGIEHRLILRPIVDEWVKDSHASLYAALVDLFKRLEPEYNSHLFKRHFSERLSFADEAPLRTIIENLYPPKSPHRFEAIPVDLLGTIYERFIGETVEFDEKGGVEIVAKPEVKHGGGIVYTPRWVVREIVGKTLGPRVEGKTPAQLLKLRVIDPACGSGSFLLGACEILFEAHLAWYRENAVTDGKVAAAHREDIFVDAADELQLTVKKRREIILHCIYGVDKDPQAVEVAQLSLYLRILEGYGEQSFIKQKSLFKGALLPDLSRNIRNGNSLLTPRDIPQEVTNNEERQRRARAFDWESRTEGFGRITERGGFDVVVGNPPYIRIQTLKAFAPDEVDSLRAVYPAAKDGSFDIYLAFVEKALKILHEKGALGFILPMRWMKAKYGVALREDIAKRGALSAVVDFGPTQVFDGVTTYTALQFFAHKTATSIQYKWVAGGSDAAGLGPAVREHSRTQKGLGADAWYLGLSPELVGAFDRARKLGTPLSDAAARIAQGIKTGRDGIFVLHDAKWHGKVIRGMSKESDRVIEVEADACKWLIKSGQMRRFHLRQPTKVVLFPYSVTGTTDEPIVKLVPFDALKSQWPLLGEYLESHEKALRAREPKKKNGRTVLPFDRDNEWHQFSRLQNMDLPGLKKIVIADVLNRARFAFDEKASVCFMGGAAGGYGIVLKDGWNPYAVTAALNSSLLEWMLRPPGFSDWYSGGWYSGESRFIGSLPLPPLGHPCMKPLADAGTRLQESHRKLDEAKTDGDISRWKSIISADEEKVDQLMFDAFKISSDEQKRIRKQVEELRSICDAKKEDAVESDDDEAEDRALQP